MLECVIDAGAHPSLVAGVSRSSTLSPCSMVKSTAIGYVPPKSDVYSGCRWPGDRCR